MGCRYLRCATCVIAGQYATSHCKALLFWFHCKWQYINVQTCNLYLSKRNSYSQSAQAPAVTFSTYSNSYISYFFKCRPHRLLSSTSFYVVQGCVRGQHGRGQGQGQGHKILSSRCTRGRGQSSRTPNPCAFFYRASYAESGYAKSSACPSLSNSTPYCRLLCACV